MIIILQLINIFIKYNLVHDAIIDSINRDYINVDLQLRFKNNQVKEFNSFNSVSKTLRIGVNTLKRRIEDGKEWKDYTFDILE